MNSKNLRVMDLHCNATGVAGWGAWGVELLCKTKIFCKNTDKLTLHILHKNVDLLPHPPKKINKTKQKDQSSSSPFVLIFKIFQRNPRMVPSHDYSRVHCSWRSMFIIPTLPKSSVVHGPSLALSCRRHIARSFTAGSLACLFSIHRSNADCLWSLPDIKF